MTYVQPHSMAYAKSQVGTKETGNNCQQYSDEQYGVRCPPGGWCMSFASRVAREGGYVFEPGATFGPKGFAYTGSAINWAQRHGLWRNRYYRAQPGDWVIFDWNGDGLTDHVEVNEIDDGVQFVTIGGNTGNAVLYRIRDRKYVNCIIALSASSQAGVPIPPPPPDKVPPMFNPPLDNIVDAIAGENGTGAWMLREDGAVFAVGGARYYGGANGKPYFAGLKAARIQRPDSRIDSPTVKYVILSNQFVAGTQRGRYKFPGS